MLRASIGARASRIGTFRSTALATPNYSYEKRQRELAKKRKAEEKRHKKGPRVDESPADGSPPDGEAPVPPAMPAQAPPAG